MTSTIGRGLLAGAVGTTLLNLATWLDMALSGRDASDAPERTALRLAGAVGLDLPDDDNRVAAYGALSGIGAGLGVGVAASVVRRAGLRLPAPLGAAVIGAAAMAAADGPLAATGVSDPRTWTAADWTRDAAAHLAYGAGVRWALDRAEPPATEPDVEPASRSLVTRSLALGAAAGARTSLGLGPGLAGPRPVAIVTAGLTATELVMDKLPSTGSRLETPALAGRAVAGSLGSLALARRDSENAVVPIVAGAVGALAGSLAGALWRDWAAQRGWTWQGAVVEDAAAIGLTVWACR